MISAELSEQLHPVRRLQLLLWTALTLAIVLYLVVLIISLEQNLRHADAPNPTLSVIIISLGVVLALGSLVYWRYIQSDARLQKEISVELSAQDFNALLQKFSPASDAPAQISQRILRAETLNSFDKRRLAIALKSLLPWILNLALNEAVALSGLVLALTNRQLLIFLPFGIAALVLNLIMFPRTDRLMDRLEVYRT